MRCHICDARLTRMEIKRDPTERGGYKPCNKCVALSTGQPTEDEIIDNILGNTMDIEFGEQISQPQQAE